MARNYRWTAGALWMPGCEVQPHFADQGTGGGSETIGEQTLAGDDDDGSDISAEAAGDQSLFGTGMDAEDSSTCGNECVVTAGDDDGGPCTGDCGATSGDDTGEGESTRASTDDSPRLWPYAHQS